jgi:tRNA dimethylallyltransferase
MPFLRQKVIVIVGPTASGKSALAVSLARKLNGEVISADSRQVYTGLDIGTGTITHDEMKGITHHLLDVQSPKKVFTANDYVRHGRDAIDDILSRGKVPIICGGTGFYIDVLLGRVVLPNVPANLKLRTHLRTKSTAQLFSILKKLDPKRATAIDAKNPVRLIRAIEIAKALGKVPSLQSNPLPYEIRWIGIKPDSSSLRKKIRERLLARMKEGMVAEAKKLHSAGLSYTRMTELGLEYRYLALYLQKKISKRELLAELENRIWDYAGRQMTYWKKNQEITWFASNRLRDIFSAL